MEERLEPFRVLLNECGRNMTPYSLFFILHLGCIDEAELGRWNSEILPHLSFME